MFCYHERLVLKKKRKKRKKTISLDVIPRIADGSGLICGNEHISSEPTAKSALLMLLKRLALEQLHGQWMGIRLAEYMDTVTVPRVTIATPNSMYLNRALMSFKSSLIWLVECLFTASVLWLKALVVILLTVLANMIIISSLKQTALKIDFIIIFWRSFSLNLRYNLMRVH